MAAQFPVWLQTTDVVLDALAIASWPIAFGAMMFMFRAPITDLLSRMKRFNGFGNEAEFDPVEAIGKQGPTNVEGASATGLAIPDSSSIMAQTPPPDPVYDALDSVTRNILEAHVPNAPASRLAWAIRMRSISEAGRIHEQNYRWIYGSQIAALKALNTAYQAKADEFQTYFYTASFNPAWKNIYEGKTYEEWGQFLIDAGYVEIVEGSDPELVRITPFGKQFLHWMTEARAFEGKPG